jgi:hypothetical protein
METFLPYLLNTAERYRDTSKISTLGPFAYFLSKITSSQFSNEGTFYHKLYVLEKLDKVYRGVRLPEKIFEEYKNKFIKKENL